MTLTEHSELAAEYAKVTGTTVRSEKVKFIGAQPETLHQRHVQQVLSGSHAIAHKIDGERCLLFVSQNCHVYQLGRNERFIASGLWSKREQGTILDVELCDGVLHAFDIIYRHGRRMSQLLHDRLGEMQSVVDTLTAENKQRRQAPTVLTKQHYFSDIPRYFKEWDSSTRDAGQPLREGFIFTPIHEPYPTSTKWPMLLKWKPYEANSIDFQICVEADGRWTLLVGDADRRLVPFEPLPTIDASAFAGPISMHGNIVECRWNGETFVPTRWRQDRTAPNYKTVALDVWESIQNPVRATDFYQTRPAPPAPHKWQKDLMDRAKALLIEDAAAAKGDTNTSWADAMEDEENDPWNLSVLDLTAGHAYGDWKQPQFKVKVVHQALLHPPTPEHHRGNPVPEKFNVVDCRCILSCFYASQETFSRFLQTVSERLRPGGYLVTCFLDGQSVYEACVRTTESDYTPLFDLHFPLAHLRKQEFQHAFRVAGQSQTLYLVFPDMFTKRMTDAGFECVDTQLVQDISKLDRPKVYRTFIFRYIPGRAMSRWPATSHPVFGELFITPMVDVHACLGLRGGDRVDPGDKTTLEAFADDNGTYVNVVESTDVLTEYAPKVTLDEASTLVLLLLDEQLHIACRRCEDTGEKVIRFPRPKPNPARVLLERPLSGKNAWTIKDLHILAHEKGINVPSKERLKQHIYTYILNKLSA